MEKHIFRGFFFLPSWKSSYLEFLCDCDFLFVLVWFCWLVGLGRHGFSLDILKKFLSEIKHSFITICHSIDPVLTTLYQSTFQSVNSRLSSFQESCFEFLTLIFFLFHNWDFPNQGGRMSSSVLNVFCLLLKAFCETFAIQSRASLWKLLCTQDKV